MTDENVGGAVHICAGVKFRHRISFAVCTCRTQKTNSVRNWKWVSRSRLSVTIISNLRIFSGCARCSPVTTLLTGWNLNAILRWNVEMLEAERDQERVSVLPWGYWSAMIQSTSRAVLTCQSQQVSLKTSILFRKNSVAWVRERTIPTERPPLVDEVSAIFHWIEGATWLAWQIPTAVFLDF
jgi:hypothetical protein